MITSFFAKLSLRSNIHSPIIISKLHVFSYPSLITKASFASIRLLRSYSTTIPPSIIPTSNLINSTSVLPKPDSSSILKKRDLPRNVTFMRGNLEKPYRAYFIFMLQKVEAGRFSSPEEASDAVQKKRFELQSNPTLSLEVKPARDLPHGMHLSKTNKKNPYRARYSYNGEPLKNLGSYPTPKLASKAYEEKMAELRLVMPKEEQDLPDGVHELNDSGKYYGKFRFHTKIIQTSYFSTPELAFEALEKRRAECLADPKAALKLKPPRDLRIGVHRVKMKSKKDGIRATYRYVAQIRLKGKHVLQTTYSTPQLAFGALNKRGNHSEYRLDSGTGLTLECRS